MIANKAYTDALNMNRRGAALFERGRFKEAIGQFRSALEVMKDCIFLVDNHKARRALPYSSSSTRQQFSTILRARWSDRGPLSPQKLNGTPSAFRRAVIVEISLSTSSSLANTFSSESSIILYNLALTFHLLGIKQGSPTHLQSALKLYGMAHLLNRRTLPLPGDDCNHCDHDDDLSHTMEIAILNNRAQCYYELVDYASVAECFGQLSIKLHLLRAYGINAAFEQSDSEEFALNLMLFTNPESAPAA